jgi:cytochrome c-type biogenesis protein CcmH/NrfG
MADERILEMLHAIERRLTVVEHEREDAIPGPRVLLLVKQHIEPIEKAVQGIERSVERQSTQMETLAEKSEELYEAHKQMLKKEQEQKDKEAEERTLGATLKRWGAIAASIGGIWFVFRIAGTLIEAYLRSRGITP